MGASVMKKAPINPFDSESENRHEAFRAMRREAAVHEVAGSRRFVVSQRGVAEGLAGVDFFENTDPALRPCASL